MVLNSEAFSQLVKDDVSHSFSDMPAAIQDDLLQLVGQVSEWKPLLQLDRRQTLMRGSFQLLEALAMLLPGGF